MQCCFFTRSYRGHYIHSSYDDAAPHADTIKVQIVSADGRTNLYPAKTVIGAKRIISRHVNTQAA